VELVDLILVNKADGVLETPARMAQIEYTSALKFVSPKTDAWRPKVKCHWQSMDR
jgi:LAO/AO transport system kinase